MCGIVGFQGDFDVTLLQSMCEQIAHRGPDADGTSCHAGHATRGAVGLGHRRLAIIDLSPSGRQPMVVACERCRSTGANGLTLVYNGEIYNFPELRAELEGKGHTFHSRTDSEVLLHLYAEHGLEMTSRLNGIFAFAIHDDRESGRPATVERGDLFLARDPLGVKPLYLAETGSGFLFGSEIKALLRSPEVSRELSAEAIHFQLAYLWTPAPLTVLEGVRKLPPGFAAIARGGRIVREWEFYDLPYGRPPLEGSEEELAAELRELVERAVDRQMVADVPVGAFLSGGLDSSAVVAMMRRVRPDYRPTCYCIGFAEGESIDGVPPDLPFARRVAEHLDVPLQTLEVRSDMIRHLERMLYHLDEPQADPAPINALLIAEQARRDGIPVLLSGAGGDDLFTGYRRHRAIASEHLWSWLPAPARGMLAAAVRGVLPGSGSSMGRRAAKLVEHIGLDGPERMASYFWWSGEALRRALYAPDFARRVSGVQTARPLLESLERIPGERSAVNRMLYLEGKHFLADHNLNYTDKTGMAAGIEVRVPLLDLPLVDFATRIPPRMKQRGGTGKYLFKRAMEPLLPRDVIYRAKSGFGAPLRHWLRNDLREQVEEYLSADRIARRGIFDPAAVRKLIENDREGRVDASYTIFAMMCLEIWCGLFVDARLN